MKTCVFLGIGLCFGPLAQADDHPTLAAEEDRLPEFDKLRTPDSPAFVILGVSPTEIQQPTTPRALAIALAGFVTGTDPALSIPRSFALEVAPYWLYSHSELAVRDYREDDLMRPLRTLSISIGTSESTRTDGTTIVHSDSNVGVGLRTMLFQAGNKDGCTRKAESYGVAISNASILSTDELEQVAAAGADGAKRQAEIIQDKITTAQAALTALKQDPSCVALATSTTGFSVDLAAAVAFRAEDSKLTRSSTSIVGYGVWSNASYAGDNLSGVAMVRLAGREDEVGKHHVFDAGLRGVLKHRDHALSIEGLLRYRFTSTEDGATYRLGVAVEHKIVDDVWLSFTFGKDFAFRPGDVGQMFSLANVQFGLGRRTL